MQDIDLSGVDPRRWAETRRRIGIIREWIAGGRHSKQEGAEYAERIGLSYKQFMRLVSAWKKHGEPARLDGAGMKRGATRESRMPPVTRQAVMDAIAALGPDARFVDVVREAERRSREAGTHAPSAGMIHYMLMRARQQAGPRAGAPEVLIGRIGCRLPMIDGEEVTSTPELIVAVLAPEGIIVAHELVLAGDIDLAFAKVLAQTVPARAGDLRERQVVLGKELSVGRELASCLPARFRVAPVGQDLARLLGSFIGTIPIRHRIRSSKTAPAAVDSPLSVADAIRAIQIAVEAHNAARSAPTT